MIITEVTLLRHPKWLKRLTPLAKYQGPLLQLTEAESKKIAALKKETVFLNTEICELFRNIHFTNDTFAKEGMNNEISEKAQTVKNIENEIRRIKVNRHKAQKAEMEV